MFNARVLAAPVTIQGTITGGSISVPESAVAFPPPPRTAVPVATIAVVAPSAVTTPVPKKQEFALGFARSVVLREPYEFLEQEETSEEFARRQEALREPKDLPEVEVSAVEYSRIHPGLRADR